MGKSGIVSGSSGSTSGASGSSGSSGSMGSMTLTSGAITITGGSSRVYTAVDLAQPGEIVLAKDEDLDQVKLELFQLQQTVRALMRANIRLGDEIDALKAGVILDPPGLA